MAEKKRIVWIDQLRGIAFYFVILGHMVIPAELEVWIYSFHMPLFFIISGFNLNVEKMYKTDFKSYISHLAKRMLVPYLWLQFAGLGMKYLLYVFSQGRELKLAGYIKGILIGNSFISSAPSNPLYFVLLLFLAQIVIWFLIRLTKANKLFSFAGVLALSLFSVVTEGKNMPWHINVIPTAMLFMFIGRFLMDLYKAESERLEKLKKPVYAAVCAVLFALGAVLAFFNGRASIHGNLFGKNYIAFVISAVLTSVAFSLVVMVLPTMKVINFIGMNTIFLLGIHEPYLLTVKAIFPELWKNSGLFVAVASVVCHFLPVPVLWLVGKLAPYVCGNPIKENTFVIKASKFVAVAVVIAAPSLLFTKYFLDGALRINAFTKALAVLLFGVAVVLVKMLFDRFASVVFLDNSAVKEKAAEKSASCEDDGVVVVIPVEEE